MKKTGLAALGLLISIWVGSSLAAAGDPVTLAQDGSASLPIVVSASASLSVQAAASELAEQLQRICGGSFQVLSTEGQAAVYLGLPGDFAHAPGSAVFNTADLQEREAYVLQSDGASLYLIGASDNAVEHAVWDLLGRLGFRQYFMSDTWEIVPDLPTISVELDVRVKPDYAVRMAPRNAPWTNTALWGRWHKRNRITSGFEMSTGHSYGSIIRANRAEFDAHPEYFALVDGQRDVEGSKFCLSNVELRQMIVEYAKRTVQNDLSKECVSMEPSDGGGWCQCEFCASMGSISDRVLTLANDVAAGINSLGLGSRYVAFYAYNQHSPPATIQAHSNVIVNAATGFIRDGFSIEEMIEGWGLTGARIGIREYHDYFSSSHDIPRIARGGSIGYLKRTIPLFHTGGARFINSESSDSWGANGLGYWLTPIMLWDIGQADNLDFWIDDFLQKSFGNAAEVMREFYTMMNLDGSLMSDENVVAKLYDCLDRAYACQPGADVRERLDDLVLFARYVELYHIYRGASGEDRQNGFEMILKHAYRMRERYMLATRAIYERNQFRDSAVEVPPEADWSVPEPQNIWKDSTPYTSAEIAGMITNGMGSYPLDIPDFESVSYSANLVPATPLNPPVKPAGSIVLDERNQRSYWLWMEAPGSFTLGVQGGKITHYQDRGNVIIKFSVFKGGLYEQVDYNRTVPPDYERHDITLTSPYGGLHRLDIADGNDKTQIFPPANIEIVHYTPFEAPQQLPGTWTAYVYIPPGTTVFGGFTSALNGNLRDSNNNIMLSFAGLQRPGYFSVAVPANEGGTFWKFEKCKGYRIPMTVPPVLALTPQQMLLPAELVYETAPYPAFGAEEEFSTTAIRVDGATFQGVLATPGAAAARVTVYWGDGVSWLGQRDLGEIDPGTFQMEVDGLTPGGGYVWQAQAWHAYGSSWSAPLRFSTLNTLPFIETFEGLSPGTLDFRHGWYASETGAALVVQDAAAPAGQRYGTILGGRAGQHFGPNASDEEILWFDMLLRPNISQARLDGQMPFERAISDDQSGSALFYVDYTTGILVVYDGQTALPITTVEAMENGDWGRFTVRGDYPNSKWSLWMNGSLVARDLGFYDSSRGRLSELAFEEYGVAGAAAAFDNISIALGWEGRPNGLAIRDSDNDGIDDDWEMFWFGSLTVADAHSDFDGDGQSDLAEFLAGTDPSNAKSLLAITRFSVGDEEIMLSWPSVPERLYQVVAKERLDDPIWIPYLSGIAAKAPTNTVTIQIGEEAPAFFRIRLEGVPALNF